MELVKVVMMVLSSMKVVVVSSKHILEPLASVLVSTLLNKSVGYPHVVVLGRAASSSWI